MKLRGLPILPNHVDLYTSNSTHQPFALFHNDDDNDSEYRSLSSLPSNETIPFTQKLFRLFRNVVSIVNPDGTCNQFNIVNLAIVYDSTFCSDEGGNAIDAESSIRQIIADVSIDFQQVNLCVTMEISHLEGFCNENDDPFRGDIVREFGPKDERLTKFRRFWNTNPDRDVIDRDVTILFTGKGTEMAGGYLGNAFVSTICQKRNAFATVAILPSTILPPPATLMAHELGHTLGAYSKEQNHYPGTGDYIMKAQIGTGCEGFVQNSVVNMRALIDERQCLDVSMAVTANARFLHDTERLGVGVFMGSFLLLGVLSWRKFRQRFSR